MTTTEAPSIPDLLDATRDWQRTSIDEATAQCDALLQQALNAPDPETRKVLLAEVHVLSGLSIEHMDRITTERVRAFAAHHEGQSEIAIKNLLEIGRLVRESGLPGVATYLADVQTHVDVLYERMGKAEQRLDDLEERVSKLERGTKPPRQSRPAKDTDTPRDWSKTNLKEPWSDRLAKVQTLFKKHVGIQELPFKEAFPTPKKKRYKPVHSARG